MLGAVILGTALVLFAGGILLIGGLTSIVSMGLGASSISTSVPQNSVLVIGFENGIATQDTDKPLAGYAPDFLNIPSGGTGLLSLVKAIHFASVDPSIRMIYLHPQYLNAQITHIEELRNALQLFRQSGKPVICYADTYSQAAYYLATVADKVIINPLGTLQLQGMSLDVLYFKDLFDKLGVQAQVIRHGSYKSGGEQFILSQMSDAERTQNSELLDNTWVYIAHQIASARNMELPNVEQACQQLFMSPALAKDEGFVDEIWYKDQFIDYMCGLCNVSSEKQIRSISLDNYAALTALKTGRHSKNKIALVYATGEIMLGSGQDGIYSEDFSAQLRQYAQDSTVKAVVMRVDSPGGDPLAAEVVRRELVRLAHNKPLIVSCGDMAASGGYWIASPAHTIFTNPQSIVGSIGVYSLFFNGKEALDKTLHISNQNVSSHPNSQFPSYFVPLTTQQIDQMQVQIDSTYLYFLDIVAEGRKMSISHTDSIAQGRTWSGMQAMELHLADHVGGLTDALTEAASQAGLSEYELIEYPQPLSFIQSILSGSMQNALSRGNLNEIKKILTARQGIRADVPYKLAL